MQKYIIGGLTLLLTGVATPLAAHAAGCTNGTLKGTFGFQSTVMQNNETPPHFLELVGLFRFDGQGEATESFAFAQSDGPTGSEEASLTYSVTSDCRFTMEQNNGETFAGVIVRSGEEFYFIETSGDCCGSAIIRRGNATRLRTSQN